MRVAVALMVLAACSGEATTPRPKPASCDSAMRRGTYLVEETKLDGNCGDGTRGLVVVDGKLSPGCTVHRNVFSDNGCKLESDISCVSEYRDPLEWGGVGTVTSRGIAVTSDVVGDGSRLEGSRTYSASASDGSTCRGSYSVAATRQ